MTRQIDRKLTRAIAKTEASIARRDARKVAKRALLERQTAREKAGAYKGRSTASAMAMSRSRLDKRKIQKGKPHGRVLRTITQFGREFYFHATKGWRSFRTA